VDTWCKVVKATNLVAAVPVAVAEVAVVLVAAPDPAAAALVPVLADHAAPGPEAVVPVRLLQLQHQLL
jgi:hypothetical protein